MQIICLNLFHISFFLYVSFNCFISWFHPSTSNWITWFKITKWFITERKHKIKYEPLYNSIHRTVSRYSLVTVVFLWFVLSDVQIRHLERQKEKEKQQMLKSETTKVKHWQCNCTGWLVVSILHHFVLFCFSLRR